MQSNQLKEQTSKIVNLLKIYTSIRFRPERMQAGPSHEGDHTSRMEETNRLIEKLSSRQVQLLRLKDTWSKPEREQLEEVIDLVDRLKQVVQSVHSCQWQLFQLEQEERLCGHQPDVVRKSLIRENQGKVLQGCWSRS